MAIAVLDYSTYSNFRGKAPEDVFEEMEPMAAIIVDRLLFGAVRDGRYTSQSPEWTDIQHAVAEQVNAMANYDSLRDYLQDCDPSVSRSDAVGSMSHSESIDAGSIASSARASGYFVPRAVYYWLSRHIARQRMVEVR